MAVSFNELWKMVIDKDITETEMRKRAGISTSVFAKIGKSETVSIESLAKICVTLD